MFGSPRVVAIDDDPTHLTGLANGLNRHGVACLQIPFTGEALTGIACPDVRIIFADLHLGAGTLGQDPRTDFAVLGELLEGTIRPTGPYFIFLWTMYGFRAPGLQAFLEQRVVNATKPLAVLPLDKTQHLDATGQVRDEDRLLQAIHTATAALPQVGALFDWETRVLGATGDTLSSVLELAASHPVEQRPGRMAGVLNGLGEAAVGRPHVAGDPFAAVNEALLPILADRIANLRPTEGDGRLWQQALDGVTGTDGLSAVDGAKLNRLIHIAEVLHGGGVERGAVVPLPEQIRGTFQDVFRIEEDKAAGEQFRCKDFDKDDPQFRWVLVQCQAACDRAQSQPGSLPWYLGLEFPDSKTQRSKPPAAVWNSPTFAHAGELRRLRVNARFPISPSAAVVRDVVPLYRLREQVLNDLIYHLHGYGARPGLISLRDG